MLVALILLILAFVVIQWRANAREQAAEANFPPTGQIIKGQGLPVHVQEMGSGPDLVMIHGANGNLREFTFDLAQRLQEHFRIIAVDRPGLGWTAGLPGYGAIWGIAGETPQEQARVLQQAADSFGVKNPIVLGHSFGGAVALAWGLSRPQDTAALVLLGGVSQPWSGGLGWPYNVISTAAGGALVVPLATAFLPDRSLENGTKSVFAPQPVPQGYIAHVGPALALRRRCTRANARQVNGLLAQIIEMKRQYGALNMPIELVHGDKDTIVPAHVHSEVFAHDMPTANLTLLPGVGHMPHHADPGAVVDATLRAAARAGLR